MNFLAYRVHLHLCQNQMLAQLHGGQFCLLGSLSALKKTTFFVTVTEVRQTEGLTDPREINNPGSGMRRKALLLV